ncbi:MAG: hypothetical protein ACK5P5_06380 [Pseudobdellovibrionaceae bacterium]
MRHLTLLFLCLGSLLTTACNKPITDYVKGGKLPILEKFPSSVPPNFYMKDAKDSPSTFTGHDQTYNNGSIQGRVTTEAHLVPAGDMSAEISLHTHRRTFQ